MNLNSTHQSLLFFSSVLCYWHTEKSCFRTYNYWVTALYFSKIIFHCQLHIFCSNFLIYVCSNILISSRGSERVKYIQSHKNVKKHKTLINIATFVFLCVCFVLFLYLRKCYLYESSQSLFLWERGKCFLEDVFEEMVFLCIIEGPSNLHFSLSSLIVTWLIQIVSCNLCKNLTSFLLLSASKCLKTLSSPLWREAKLLQT